VEIGGHTDDDGTVAENQVLSQRRADAVKAYLESKGIDGDRMEAVGYGEEEPKVPNTSSLGKAENRRIEFTIL
jgi:outer membrane protein OmpA-like peptidoglycan-associated protein